MARFGEVSIGEANRFAGVFGAGYGGSVRGVVGRGSSGPGMVHQPSV